MSSHGEAISPRGDMPKNRVRVFHQGRTMSSINSISADKLARLIGVPHCPVIIDVRTDKDYEADPRFPPGALRRRPESVSDWASEFVGRASIVIDKSGGQVSEGVAAWLRHAGASSSDVLAGGHLAWVKAAGPLIPIFKSASARRLRANDLGHTLTPEG